MLQESMLSLAYLIGSMVLGADGVKILPTVRRIQFPKIFILFGLETQKEN
jgi:hypothetical protein